LTLEELLKLVSEENQESVKAFFTEQANKITSLSDEITELEKKGDKTELQGKLDDAIAKRDAAKAQLTVVRDTLGLPADKEVTKDLVTEHLDDTSKGDAEKDNQIKALKADIVSLEESVDNLKSEKATVESERDAVSEETKFIKVFSESMPSFKPVSAHARKTIEKLMRENAVLEDGAIVYKENDSYIRVAGEKVDMKARLAEIEADEDYTYLFESKASGGSGSPNGGTKGGTVSKFDERRRKANV